MDASSAAAACCSSSNGLATGEATIPLIPQSSSLPPSHYLQTCPQLLSNDACKNAVVAQQLQSSNSLNFDSSRRRSLKCETKTQSESVATESDLANSNSRSTSSPQLLTGKSRSKVYRRASVKSLSSCSAVSPSQSRIIKVSSRKNSEKRLFGSRDEDNKENHLVCNPLSNPYPYSTPCHEHSKNSADGEQDEKNGQHRQEEEKQQQAKAKSSCSSFLPILSLIPHTVISFQYPSPKMKFSWWRNKIS